jgi:hypothetical protein
MLLIRSILLASALACLALGQVVVGTAQPAKHVALVKPANQNYVQIDVAELLRHPAEYAGRRVTVTAEVVSVNAQKNALSVYDQRSRAQLGVSLSEISKTQRRRIVADPIHQVALFGRVELQDGQPCLKAEQVLPVELTLAVR